jgi:hypothetical protein
VGILHPRGNAQARQRTSDFIKLAAAAVEGLSYSDSKERFSISSNQVETRKSLFEEIGLLYVPHGSNRLVLTPVGRQLFDLLDGKDLTAIDKLTETRVTTLIAYALSSCQVDRPQSRGSPALSRNEWTTCQVRPYSLIWLALKDLGGVLYLHEFLGRLRKVWDPSEYPDMIQEIQTARKTGTVLATNDELVGSAEMNYRIYWKSHLSIADRFLSFDQDKQAFVLESGRRPLLEAILSLRRGCEGDDTEVIAARPWVDVDDYYRQVAQPCPPFLQSGSPVVVDFDGQSVANLEPYLISSIASGYTIEGGAELCRLPLRMPCFHPSVSQHLLRVDAKEQIGVRRVRMRLGMGRPIVDLTLLTRALKGSSLG